MRLWLLATVLLLSTPVFGAAYKWVDDNGQVHYSDRPREGAQEIPLPATRTAPAVPQGARQQREPVQPTPAAQANEPYQRISISQPTQQQTLWNIEGNLDVTVELAPALRSGHRVAVNLDGNVVDLRPSGLSFQVPNVFRGVHRLEALVLDLRGNVLIRSEPVMIMVQQTSILNPQRANPNRAGG
jgi:hypothetical protein